MIPDFTVEVCEESAFSVFIKIKRKDHAEGDAFTGQRFDNGPSTVCKCIELLG